MSTKNQAAEKAAMLLKKMSKNRQSPRVRSYGRITNCQKWI